MPNVVESFYHVLTPSSTLPPSWTLHGPNWILIFTFILVPLAFLRRMDSLRHTSYVALFSVGQFYPSLSRSFGLIIPCSISRRDRDSMLLLAATRNAYQRRSSMDSLRTQLCFNLSGSSLRIHLFAECKPKIYQSWPPVDSQEPLAVPSIQRGEE